MEKVFVVEARGGSEYERWNSVLPIAYATEDDAELVVLQLEELRDGYARDVELAHASGGPEVNQVTTALAAECVEKAKTHGWEDHYPPVEVDFVILALPMAVTP